MKLLLLAILLVGIIGISIFLYRCNKSYYAQYNIVKKELKKIQNIEIVNIWGNEDLTLEDIYATIKLQNGDTLRFSNLSKQDFQNTPSITLSKINNWEFHSTGCMGGDQDWSGSSINIGQYSDYEEIKNLNLRNIQDVVSHVEALKALVKKIPEYPKFDTLQRKGDDVFVQKYNIRKISTTRELKWADCP